MKTGYFFFKSCMNTIQSYEDKVLLLATAYVFCMNVIESYEDRVLLAAVGVLCMKTPFSCIKNNVLFLAAASLYYGGGFFLACDNFGRMFN